MKRIGSIFILFLFLLSSCNNSTPIEKGNYEMSIFVASDLHLYSSNLIGENNITYTKDKITSDGRVQEYDYELVEEFVEQINISKPEYVLLTGDLSYNGEKDSHLELIKILNKVNADTKVLVIPGNHDIYSTNSFSLLKDNVSYILSTTEEEFEEMYADFGYIGAYSYDEKTLSYIYELSDDKWVLMLDTNLSRYNYVYEMNIVGGQLFDSTYDWIEENLKYAADNNIEVIATSHHNLLTVNSLFETSYTLYESTRLLDLYTKYGVKINFSGHLHVQSIKKYQSDNGILYDIASNSLLDYGNRYGVLDIYDNCFDYNTYKCSPFEGFEEYSYNVFYSKYYNKSVKGNVSKFGDLGEEITDLIASVNCFYFNGNYEEIHRLKNSNKSLFRKIKKSQNNEYPMSLFDVENRNQHNLIFERI